MKRDKVLLVIDDYKIKSTGADGGHKYISTEIEVDGNIKRLAILFENKSDEKELEKGGSFTVKGDILDDDKNYDLIMSNATLVN